jgi:hypothetical protein
MSQVPDPVIMPLATLICFQGIGEHAVMTDLGAQNRQWVISWLEFLD